MQIIEGDMFDPQTYSIKVQPDAICVTTNGAINAENKAVMGRGCAKEVARRYSQVPYVLGQQLLRRKNRVHVIHVAKRYIILSFPVKPIGRTATKDNVVENWKHAFPVGRRCPGWACKAELDIIERSAKQLVAITDVLEWEVVILPRPGCGAGELNWTAVRPILQPILDDRFYVITFAPK